MIFLWFPQVIECIKKINMLIWTVPKGKFPIQYSHQKKARIDKYVIMHWVLVLFVKEARNSQLHNNYGQYLLS